MIFIAYWFKVIVFISIASLVFLGLVSKIPFGPQLFIIIRNIIIIVMLFPLVDAFYSISSGISNGQFYWFKYFYSLPYNYKLVSDGPRWASQEIMNSSSSCIFDFSNNGVINGLTILPLCSRFSYIVYADQSYEYEIIESLRIKKPKAIVYSSKSASFCIDGKSMIYRFPNLNNFILQKYPKSLSAYGYCVRYLDQGIE